MKLTKHATEKIKARRIDLNTVKKVLQNPQYKFYGSLRNSEIAAKNIKLDDRVSTLVIDYTRIEVLVTSFESFLESYFSKDSASFSFNRSTSSAMHKLFDLGTSARRAARKASVSYPTALDAFDCIKI